MIKRTLKYSLTIEHILNRIALILPRITQIRLQYYLEEFFFDVKIIKFLSNVTDTGY